MLTELTLLSILLVFAIHKHISSILQPLSYFLRTGRLTPLKIDIFAPSFAFPVAFSLIYGFGNIEFTDYETEIPTSHFFVYAYSLFSFFVGLNLFKRLEVAQKLPASFISRNEKKILMLIFLVVSLISVSAFIASDMSIFASDIESLRTSIIRNVGGWIYYIYKTLPLIFILITVFYIKSFG